MDYSLHLGDCLETLRGMPDNSVDSVVTDPPYGLSSGSTKGVTDRLADALLDVVLPDLYNANVQMGCMGEFSGPRDSVSFLDFMLRTAREEPGVAVPESAVDFQSYVANQKVEHTGEGAGLASDGVLSNEFVAHGGQFGGDFILQPRHNGNAPLRDGVRGLFREQGAGRICVPVVIAQNSSFSRFLGGLCPAIPSFLGDLVGFCNGAGGSACSSSGIVAGGRAEISAMLALDSRNGSIELIPANAAFQGEIVFEVCAAQPVRASAGAGGLPAKFEPRTVGVIGDGTNRAATFHFHKALLEAMNFSRKGFMGKDWDGNVPSTEIWAECLRVLKPGGHLLAFAGTRTQHRMAVRIEDAGFEIRDMIAWVYGSGFPKSGNTALKPALEPITMARKPLIGTVAANILKFGTGALNIDDCRVGSESTARTQRGTTKAWEGGSFSGEVSTGSDSGRWPANLIHDGSAEVVTMFPYTKSWTKSPHHVRTTSKTKNSYGERAALAENFPGDEGSAARFFYCAKTGKKDRNEGLDAFPETTTKTFEGGKIASGKTPDSMGGERTSRNNHPTVKPTDLMAYLLRLVTPPGGTALDPFMGSGSTGKAAMREGFRFIGCELDEKYMAIAKARIEHELSLINAGTETQAERQAELFA